MDDARQKTCATCNASHQNTVERVLRCMGCVAKPNGNSNWRPIGHNDRVEGRDAALSRRVPSHDGLEGNGTGHHE